jgi:hypothetical protein
MQGYAAGSGERGLLSRKGTRPPLTAMSWNAHTDAVLTRIYSAAWTASGEASLLL